ncbi:phage terminase large subunit family protein [Phytomonospora endophytica]|uniref:Terminase n=1 Tax=Phytomonospora endophytica TaxID=714109 RepID=A0A841FX48_9ACTN|nr:phage terminase large subunit family protein [Phytomonospora endophytica]MBB6039323.1 hypothetical protein [Phytomonospora endophytica]GIG69735.1 hypothetical protein Pen01_60300 [Phytomonospora endophytica]
MLCPVPPRYATARDPSRLTFGGKVAKVSTALGAPFMPWQRQVCDTALEITPTGQWAYRVVVVTVPRQAGKSLLLGALSAHRCLTGRRRRVWMTAQTRADARDLWLEHVDAVDSSPLSTLITSRMSNGSEELKYTALASTLRPFSPGPEALHGKTTHLVSVDEAWAFDAVRGAELAQAIIPTQTTTDAQLWIVSTAGTATSAWLREFVDKGRDATADPGPAGTRRSTVAYFEWSLPDGAATDVETVYQNHPARGYTLRPDAIASAAELLPPGEFARAYGNRWTQTAELAIPAELWEAAREREPDQPEPGGPVLTWDGPVDGSSATIGIGWRDDSGRLVAEVADRREGTAWVVPRLLELAGRWRPRWAVADSRSPIAHVTDEVRRHDGLAEILHETSATEYTRACAGLLAGMRDGGVRLAAHPALDAAAEVAAKRSVGDGWAWGRRGSAGDIAPLVAVTLAAWAVENAPAELPEFAILLGRARRRRERRAGGEFKRAQLVVDNSGDHRDEFEVCALAEFEPTPRQLVPNEDVKDRRSGQAGHREREGLARLVLVGGALRMRSRGRVRHASYYAA